MIRVIGAGLAGCEAAWQIAQAGLSVALYDMKPKKHTPAHHADTFAELVCSNSLKASRLDSAPGMLKAEMERLGSLLVPCAKATAVEAGGALAVERYAFSRMVTEKIRSHPNIMICEEEVERIPEGKVILATGPLTADTLAREIALIFGEQLSFYDAAAPIVTRESLDESRIFYASRYGRGDADYINCPMEKPEYEAFYEALIGAESAPLKEFDKAAFRVYEGCMPIEVLAKRGADTMRFGPLKPVGLTDPHTGRRPYAVVQLRKENREGTLYNLVGFQTNLKFGEQKRVFSMIPGLAHAEFMRYGVMHRNSFLNSPRLLTDTYCMRTNPDLYFAGQITGVEGYMESAGSGLVAGLNMVRAVQGKPPLHLSRETMLGALAAHVSDSYNEKYQPMGANMGILPELPERIRDKKAKYMALAQRGMQALEALLTEDAAQTGTEWGV